LRFRVLGDREVFVRVAARVPTFGDALLRTPAAAALRAEGRAAEGRPARVRPAVARLAADAAFFDGAARRLSSDLGPDRCTSAKRIWSPMASYAHSSVTEIWWSPHNRFATSMLVAGMYR